MRVTNRDGEQLEPDDFQLSATKLDKGLDLVIRVEHEDGSAFETFAPLIVDRSPRPLHATDEHQPATTSDPSTTAASSSMCAENNR